MFYKNKNDVLQMELIVPFVPEVSLYDHDFRKSFSNPLSPFQSWKMVKYKLVSDESDLSTLHRGGEGKMCKE